jgi:2-polyprenyl-6-methoxyphenol hydroxylase-like FAD-dependent oxidoreductase
LEVKVGEPTIAIHRARLHEVLLSALPDGLVRLGKQCVAIEQDSKGVNIKFQDGERARAELLIGADGINSVIREYLFPEAKPRYAGYCAWRGVVETKDMAALGTTSEAWGCGARFGIVRVDENRVYWFATSNAREATRQKVEERKPYLLKRFKGWYSPIETLIASTADEVILHNDICDLKPMRSWIKGRVVLLGDAAHATTPNMGQGACMAVESSVILAKCLTEESGLEAALSRYERIRMPRTTWVTETSWKIGQMGQWESQLACRIRDFVVALAPNSLAARQFEKASMFQI